MANTKKKAVAETAVAPAVEAVTASVAAPEEAVKPAKRACKPRKTAAAAAPAAEEKAAKPAAKTTKRPAAKKTAKVVEKVVVQIMGKDATPEDMVARAKADWEANGHSVDEIKALSVYLNTAEGKVYYVVNDEVLSGSFDF